MNKLTKHYYNHRVFKYYKAARPNITDVVKPINPDVPLSVKELDNITHVMANDMAVGEILSMGKYLRAGVLIGSVVGAGAMYIWHRQQMNKMSARFDEILDPLVYDDMYSEEETDEYDMV